MDEFRFEKFTLLLDGIHKGINRLKDDIAPAFGVKSVHLLWLYHLWRNPEGLTSAEIAQARKIDRSLVSREIEILEENGYITLAEVKGRRRKYNARILLTDKGRELAERIAEEALRIQNTVDAGISEGELEAFYITLEKLHRNFEILTAKTTL